MRHALSDGWTAMLWPPSIRATVDPEVELVKPYL
jgi:hypothetical protein